MSFPLLQLLPDCPTSLPTRLHALLLIISLKMKTKAKQENQNNLKKKRPVRQKKKNVKTKYTKTKQKHQNKHGVHFVLATTGHGSWCAVDKPSVTPLEKRDFPSSSRNQLQIAPWLGGKALCPLPLLSAGTLSSLSSVGLVGTVPIALVVSRRWHLESSTTSGSYRLSASSWTGWSWDTATCLLCVS